VQILIALWIASLSMCKQPLPFLVQFVLITSIQGMSDAALSCSIFGLFFVVFEEEEFTQ